MPCWKSPTEAGLNRRGEIVNAVRQLYGIPLQRDPGLKQLMVDVSRKRELELAL